MSNETVLITGASSGIGLELARLFAADRSNLVLVARRLDRLESLAAELRDAHGVEVRAIAADLAEPDAPKTLFEQLAADGVAVDVLVNNAGFGAHGPMLELSIERQLGMVQVNVAALTRLTRLFLPAMLERGRGGLLNVASTAAFQPGPKMAVYFATKAYVLSLTEALAEELRRTPLAVSCLAPGPTHTEFGKAANMEDVRMFRLGAMDAATVARIGYRGFRRGRVIVVTGFMNRVGTLGSRLFPRWAVRKVVAWAVGRA